MNSRRLLLAVLGAALPLAFAAGCTASGEKEDAREYTIPLKFVYATIDQPGLNLVTTASGALGGSLLRQEKGSRTDIFPIKRNNIGS